MIQLTKKGKFSRALQLHSFICQCLENIGCTQNPDIYNQLFIIYIVISAPLLPLPQVCSSHQYRRIQSFPNGASLNTKHLAQLSQLISLHLFPSTQNMTTPQFEVHWTALINPLLFVNPFVAVRFPTQSYSQRPPCTIGQVCSQPL